MCVCIYIHIYIHVYIVEIDNSSKQELHIQGCHVEIKRLRLS